MQIKLPKPACFLKTPSAFTLIELLVVIGIIAVLASLQLPLWAAGKDRSVAMTCLANLERLGTAMQMYVHENNDYIVYNNWDGSAYSTSGGPGWLYDNTVTFNNPIGGCAPDPNMATFRISLASCYQPMTNGVPKGRGSLLYQYLSNPSYFFCPIDIQQPSYVKDRRRNMLSSYIMNGAPEGFDLSQRYRTCKITAVWSQRCYVMWEPDENSIGIGNPGALEFNDGANYPAPTRGEGIGRLHSSKGGNILAVDGHAEFKSVTTFASLGNSPGKNLLWWSPYTTDGHGPP
jgi:prepilin-type N-terminal cleavage/methylation domain-containing protein/prepilin-type processing-associated H-X9-DG protein